MYSGSGRCEVSHHVHNLAPEEVVGDHSGDQHLNLLAKVQGNLWSLEDLQAAASHLQDLRQCNST